MDNLDWEEKTNRKNSNILPKSIRGLIVGKSGCGKTNLLLNLLLKPELLDYNKLFVYGKSLFQPKYKILQCGFNNNLDKECIYNILSEAQLLKVDTHKLNNIPVAGITIMCSELCKIMSRTSEGGFQLRVNEALTPCAAKH